MEEQKDLLKDLRDFQKSLFDHATIYGRLIMGLGYGGFFAAWSGAKSYMGRRALIWSALLVLVSLCGYIMFEILQTLIISLSTNKLLSELGKPGITVALIHYDERKVQAQQRFMSIWIWVFVVCTALGLAGAGILVCSFVRSLIRY